MMRKPRSGLIFEKFGFAGEITVIAPGINAKMNELQAAYGLLQLKRIDSYIARRKEIAELYRKELSGIKGIRLLNDIEGVNHSYTYFPILVDESLYVESRDSLYERLRKNNIYGRRYFYPLISDFPTYRGLPSAKPENLPISRQISEKVICLPMYSELERNIVYKIKNIIQK